MSDVPSTSGKAFLEGLFGGRPGEMSIEEEIALRIQEAAEGEEAALGGYGGPGEGLDDAEGLEDEEALTSETQRLLEEFYGAGLPDASAGRSRKRSHLETSSSQDSADSASTGSPRAGGRRKGRRKSGFQTVKRSYDGGKEYGSLEEALADDEEFESAVLKGASRKRSQRLPEALEGLLGQANVAAAMGRPEEAVEMIHQIITEHANAAAPYQTLATIYDSMGDEEKELEAGLMGAFLDPATDGETWAGLAKLALKLSQREKAIICFGRAVKAAPLDFASWKARLELLVEAQERTLELKARLDYLRVIRHAEPALVPFPAFKTSCLAAFERFEETKSKQHCALAHCLYVERAHEEGQLEAEEVDSVVSLLLDGPDGTGKDPLHRDIVKLLLAIDVASFFNARDQRISHYVILAQDKVLTSFELSAATRERRRLETEQGAGSQAPVSARMGPAGELSLLAQLLCSLLAAKLGDPSLVRLLLEEFQNVSELNSPLCLTVAKALHVTGFSEEARAVLGTCLEQSECGESPDGWELYGDVLRDAGEVHEAAAAYGSCLQLDPGHVTARVALAKLQLVSMGSDDAALETLLNAEEDLSALKDPQLLAAEVELFKTKGMWREYLRSGWTLLAYHAVPILSVQSSKDVALKVAMMGEKSSFGFGLKSEFLRSFKDSWMDKLVRRAAALMKEAGQTSAAALQPAQLYDLCFRLAGLLWREGRWWDLLLTVGFAYLVPELVRAGLHQRFLGLALVAAVRAGRDKTAFLILREGFPSHDSLRFWNLHALIYSRQADVVFHRYVLRRAALKPKHLCLSLLGGNNSLIAGSYSAALSEYLHVAKRCPTAPLPALLTGVALLHVACKKDIAQRHLIAGQAFAFLLRYRELRDCPMETAYNLGRAMHQANILFAAVHFYRLVLSMEAPVEALKAAEDPDTPQERVLMDLRPLAAWNLALIYRAAGSEDAAFALLDEWCTL